MVYNSKFPYTLVKITDDNGTVRNNLDGTNPFPINIETVTVKKSSSNAVGTFEIGIVDPVVSGTYGPVGQYNSNFRSLNNYTEIFMGAGSPGTRLISGYIKGWSKALKNKIPYIILKGQDLTKQLMNRQLSNAAIYLQSDNRDYAYVVRDLIQNKANTKVTTDTTAAPNTGVLLNSDKTFYRMPVWEAIAQLAAEVRCDFWVDASGVLNFKKRGNNLNSYVVDSNNQAISINSNKDIDYTKNVIWVYAGRIQGEQLTVAGEQKQFSTSSNINVLGHSLVGSITLLAGSIGGTPFTFNQGRDYVLKGNYGVLWMTAGSKPENGSNFAVSYLYNTYARPVTVHASDNEIQEQYSTTKSMWIRRLDIANNASGTTVQDRYNAAVSGAKAFANAQLIIRRTPRENINVELHDFNSFDVSDKISARVPELGVNSDNFVVKDVEYYYRRTAPVKINLSLEELIAEEL